MIDSDTEVRERPEPALGQIASMGRKIKERDTLDAIERYLTRNYNQELKGQTKLKHYADTEFVRCALCNRNGCKLHRHRIQPGGEYTDSNVIIVCVSCHKLIHRIINELKKDGPVNYKLAIILARIEINGR